MNKTASQIQGDVFDLLRQSALVNFISGKVYRSGLRPRDSRQEDAVVIFTTGIPGQIQDGVVTVNIYVPDLDPYGNGVLVADTKRCEEIEVASQQWIDGLTANRSDYLFRLQQTIHTAADEEIGQHFVVIRLDFRLTAF